MSFKRVIYEDSPGITVGKWIASGIAIIAAIAMLSYGLYAFLAPKYQAVDNSVFHNSQPYTDGMSQRLDSLHVQYEEAGTASARAVIRQTVRHEFSGAALAHLTDEQRAFVEEMNQE